MLNYTINICYFILYFLFSCCFISTRFGTELFTLGYYLYCGFVFVNCISLVFLFFNEWIKIIDTCNCCYFCCCYRLGSNGRRRHVITIRIRICIRIHIHIRIYTTTFILNYCSLNHCSQIVSKWRWRWRCNDSRYHVITATCFDDTAEFTLLGAAFDCLNGIYPMVPIFDEWINIV